MYQDYLVQHLTSTILQYSLMNSFHFNGHTLGFYQQAQKLKPPVLKHNKRVLKGRGGGGGGYKSHFPAKILPKSHFPA